jgi:hypothetical protein
MIASKVKGQPPRPRLHMSPASQPMLANAPSRNTRLLIIASICQRTTSTEAVHISSLLSPTIIHYFLTAQSELHSYPDTFTIVTNLPHSANSTTTAALHRSSTPATRPPCHFSQPASLPLCSEATPTCSGRPLAVTKNNQWLLIAKYL